MKGQVLMFLQMLFLIVLCCVTVPAGGAGSLDSGFGTAGVVKTNIFGNDVFRGLEVQPDGKIIAVGASGVGDFTIVRYLDNGTIDTTFSGDGIAFVDFGSTTETARDVRIQADGKIVVSGTTANLTSAVTRLNYDGTLDTSFDTDGKLVINNFAAFGLQIQSDGKIVLGGNAAGASNTDLALIRLNPNGSFDTTFDTDGIVLTNVENTDALSEIKLLGDGKIVGVGNAAGVSKSVVVRYTAAGALDTTFSGDGIALNDLSTGGEPVRSLTLDPVSGVVTTIGDDFAGSNALMLVSYLPNGNLNTAFSDDGLLLISNGILLGGSAIVQQSDRKFVCVGHRGGSTLDDLRLTRVNLNGTIDTTFGNSGFVSLEDNGGDVEKRAILIGDKLLVGNPANSITDFGLERFNLSPVPTQSGDFDGDGFSDYAIFRPSAATWFVLRSLDNTTQIVGFGANGDMPLDGDFDGDGRSDFAIFRPSVGQWWIQRSSTGVTGVENFGLVTDRPVPGDYDKDGRTDVAVFRPSTGEWLILRSSSNNTTFFGFPFGANGDIPITRQGF